MANGLRSRIPAEDRKDLGQVGYKRRLALERLGVDPKDVQQLPYFRDELRRIARLINLGVEQEDQSALFDMLQHSDSDDDAHKVWNAYRSVPESYRRLVPPEAFCQAAGVSPWKVLDLIVVVAVGQGVQRSALVAAVWHPRVVRKAVEVALTDEGHADRQDLHKAVGFLPSPKGAQTIVNVQQNATVAQSPAFVPVPRPEDTIRRLAMAFNEARQTQAAPSVGDTVSVTAQRDEAYDDKDES